MSRLVSFRTATFAALLLALPTLGGCLKVDAKTAVTTNGSGTMTMAVTIDLESFKQMAEMMKAMAEGFGGDAAKQPAQPEKDPIEEMTKDFEPETIKKELEGKEGVELVSATKEVSEDKKSATFKTTVKFVSLKHLAEAGLGGDKPGTVTALSESEGVWTYRHSMSMGNEAMGGGAGAGAMDPADDPTGMMGDMFKNFGFKFAVEVPGTIVETNGTKSESGNTATWEYDIKSIKKLSELKELVVKFKPAEGTTLQAFSYTTPEKKPEAPPEGDAAPPVK